MSFGKLRPRREAGLSIFSGYRWSWGGAPWQPLLSNASSLQRALTDGVALEICSDQPTSAGIFELAIAHKDQPKDHITVYLGSGDNLRETLLNLIKDGGELAGFLNHALKEGHVVWMRVKTKSSPEAANAARDKALADYDFAWIQQPGAKARTLALKPQYKCCMCMCKSKSMALKEGPPKFVTQQKSGLMQMLSSKKR